MLIKEKTTLPINNRIAGWSVFFYFISILLTFITDLPFRQDLYYVATVICIIAFFLCKGHNCKVSIHNELFLFVVSCTVTGVLNILFIGNDSIRKLLECAFANVIIACLLCEVKIDRRILLGITYIYCIYFAYMFIVSGTGIRLFTRYTNNYVSIVLIMPVVMYYAVSAQYGDKLSIIPALAVWFLSLLASGRSGIGASTILFVGIFMYCEFNKDNNGKRTNMSVLLRGLRIILALLVVGVLLYYLFSTYSPAIMRKFLQRGIDNQSRQILWNDYLNTTWSNLKYILLGTPKKDILIGTLQEGNTHNSFMNIHADNGLMIIVVIILIIRSVLYAIKNKMWVFLICLIAFCFRGFFDNLFWGTKGTTMLMYFLFLPLLSMDNISKWGDKK